MTVLAQLATGDVLDSAYRWLCRRRRDYSANADVWAFRRSWPREKEQIADQLRAGCFRFSLAIQDHPQGRRGNRSVVGTRCIGPESLGAGIDQAAAGLTPLHSSQGPWRGKVCRARGPRPSRSEPLRAEDRREILLCLHRDYKKGISLGCPLSPLIGAFFLNRLDAALAKLDLFYVRFMDDILVLAPTRWKLRGAVKAVNQVLECLGLDKHPDKTFIGTVERGFDFLGYHFSTAGLSVAKQTVINFIEKTSRLYEQGRGARPGVSPLEMYQRRWLFWLVGGIKRKSSALCVAVTRLGEQRNGSWLISGVATIRAELHPPR
jgi:hypothetical protein